MRWETASLETAAQLPAQIFENSGEWHGKGVKLGLRAFLQRSP